MHCAALGLANYLEFFRPENLLRKPEEPAIPIRDCTRLTGVDFIDLC